MNESDKRGIIPIGPRNPLRDIGEVIWGKPAPPRPGFRYFQCDECHHEWIEPSRDCTSPSGDNCPKCGCWCTAAEATTEQYDRLKDSTP